MYSRIFLAICISIVSIQTANSQVTSIWNRGFGNWSDASNWSSTSYPNNGNGGFDYIAVLNSGNPTLDVSVTVESLTLAGANLSSNGFDVDVNNLSSWSGGTHQGLGTTNYFGGVNLDGTTKTLNNNHVINNFSQSLWSSGSFNTGGGAAFNNLSGATLTNNFDGSFNYNLGGVIPEFNNSGLFIKSGGSGVTNFLGSFNNMGTAIVASGTLRLARGGTHSVPSMPVEVCWSLVEMVFMG